ncbi:MAG TPA: ATP-grasp domain-containing protein, partial [bacterium]|nr:ATP-grasp domain-containing protein [bacterium]
MSRTLLIIGAGVMQVPAIRIAREMGLQVAVTDYNAEAIGMRLADFPLVMSTRDVEGNVRIARDFNRRHRISGVITVGTDASMTVAAVAQALGLSGITFEAAEMATNKLKMRRRLRERGVPCPDFRAVWSLADARNAFRTLGFPAVIKPCDNMGARGVLRVGGPDEIDAAFRHAKSCTPSGELIVEQYMDGPELSIDALVVDGEPVLWGIADRIIALPPHFIELGHTLPSALPAEVQQAACDVMRAGIAALEITTGAAKGDIKVTTQGVMVGEIAARLSGGFMSSYTYPLATGIDMIKGAIKLALGEDPRPFPAPAARVALERAIIPAHGHIISISGVAEARRLPGVQEIFLSYQEGQTFPPPQSNLDKLGHVIAVGDTRAQAEAAAEAERQRIEQDRAARAEADRKAEEDRRAELERQERETAAATSTLTFTKP